MLLPVEGTAGAGLLRVALAEHLAEILPRTDQPRESRLLVAAGLAKLAVTQGRSGLVHGRDGLIQHRDRLTTLASPWENCSVAPAISSCDFVSRRTSSVEGGVSCWWMNVRLRTER